MVISGQLLFILANISNQTSSVDVSAFQCLIKFQRPQRCNVVMLKLLNVPSFRYFFFLNCCSDENCSAPKASKHLRFWVALICQPEKYVEATSKGHIFCEGASHINVITFIPGPMVKDPFIPAWKLVFMKKIIEIISQKIRQAPTSSSLYMQAIKIYCISKCLNISPEG